MQLHYQKIHLFFNKILSSNICQSSFQFKIKCQISIIVINHFRARFCWNRIWNWYKITHFFKLIFQSIDFDRDKFELNFSFFIFKRIFHFLVHVLAQLRNSTMLKNVQSRVFNHYYWSFFAYVYNEIAYEII